MKLTGLKMPERDNEKSLQFDETEIDFPIEGGYFKLFRKIFEMEVWKGKPPYYAKIYIWLYGKANHAQRNGIHRGQCLTTIDEIRFNNNLKNLSYDQIRTVVNYLSNSGLITKRRTNRGLKIKICNYDIYDDHENYKSQSKSQSKSQ